MPNLWDNMVSNELSGAAREGVLASYYELEADEHDDTWLKKIKDSLATKGEHIVNFSELEETPDLPGELIDPEDFTLQFDEMDIASHTVFLDKSVIDYAIQQIGNAQTTAEVMDVVHQMDEIGLGQKVEEQAFAKMAEWRNAISLTEDAYVCELRQILVHSQLNRFMADARECLNAMCHLYGYGPNYFMADLEREARKQHFAITAHVQATQQANLFMPGMVMSKGEVSEMVFSAGEHRKLVKQGWIPVLTVNTSLQIGV